MRRSVNAGKGRPFRFSLVMEAGRGSIEWWLGSAWSMIVGAAFVVPTGVFMALVGSSIDPVGRDPRGWGFLGAGLGALGAALYLRPRRVEFHCDDGAWRWRTRTLAFRNRWHPITAEDPIRMERETLSSVEGFTLYSGSARLLSYLGDPSTGRNVITTFREAGVPLKTVVKRSEE
jgi:hypothetical protein